MSSRVLKFTLAASPCHGNYLIIFSSLFFKPSKKLLTLPIALNLDALDNWLDPALDHARFVNIVVLFLLPPLVQLQVALALAVRASWPE